MAHLESITSQLAKSLRVAIIGSDQNAVFGRELLLSSQPDFKVVFLGHSLQLELQALSLLTFDVLLLDQVPTDLTASRLINGLGALFLASGQDLPPVIVTAPFHSKRLEVELIDAGATSLLSIEQPTEDLLAGLRSAAEDRYSYDLADLLDSFPAFGTPAIADSSFLGAIFDLDDADRQIIANLKAQSLNIRLSGSEAPSATKIKRGLRDLSHQLGMHTSKQLIYRLWQAGELG